MSHSYMWRVWLVCVTRANNTKQHTIHMRDMTHLYAWRDVSYVWYDSFISPISLTEMFWRCECIINESSHNCAIRPSLMHDTMYTYINVTYLYITYKCDVLMYDLWTLHKFTIRINESHVWQCVCIHLYSHKRDKHIHHMYHVTYIFMIYQFYINKRPALQSHTYGEYIQVQKI